VVGIRLLHTLYQFTRIGGGADEVDEPLQVAASFANTRRLVATLVAYAPRSPSSG
jgi:hypothetical protein